MYFEQSLAKLNIPVYKKNQIREWQMNKPDVGQESQQSSSQNLKCERSNVYILIW